MGGERGSKTRQREQGLICCACSRPLPRPRIDPFDPIGNLRRLQMARATGRERYCDTCAPAAGTRSALSGDPDPRLRQKQKLPPSAGAF